MTIPICACGTPKEARGAYWVCVSHCDGACNVKGGCQRCGTYGFNTNRRLNG